MRNQTAAVLIVCGQATLAMSADLRVPAEYPTIQAAVDAAEDGDCILLAPGTYFAPDPWGFIADVNLNRSLTIRGSQWPPQSTVLDGQGQCGGIRCFASADSSTKITLELLTVRNCVHPGVHTKHADLEIDSCVLSNNPGGAVRAEYCEDLSMTSSSILNNSMESLGTFGALDLYMSEGAFVQCVIESNGRDSGQTFDGGGIRLSAASLALVQCRVANNVARSQGGGMWMQAGSSAWLSQCTFEANSAADQGQFPGQGGGVYVQDGSIVVEDSEFRGNDAYLGGGVCALRSSVSVRGSFFIDNTSEREGAGLHLFDSSSLDADGSWFWGNRAGGFGGAIRSYVADVSLHACAFADNQAESGGSLHHKKGTFSAHQCTFSSNSSVHSGGAITLTGESLGTLEGCQFASNSAASAGDEMSWGSGGAISAGPSSELAILQCSFQDNTAHYGGAVICDGTDMAVIDSSFDRNVAQFRGGAVGVQNRECAVSIEGCSVRGSRADQSGGAIWIKTQSMASVSLSDSTLCQSTPEHIVGLWHDQGGVVMADYCCLGDVNNDAAVTWLDLERVIDRWGGCDLCVEDLDGSGHVNVIDLLIVLEQYGQACEMAGS